MRSLHAYSFEYTVHSIRFVCSPNKYADAYLFSYMQYTVLCSCAALHCVDSALDETMPEEVKQQLERLDNTQDPNALNSQLEQQMFDLDMRVDDTLQKVNERVQQQRRRLPFQQPLHGMLLPNVLSNPAAAASLIAPTTTAAAAGGCAVPRPHSHSLWLLVNKVV